MNDHPTIQHGEHRGADLAAMHQMDQVARSGLVVAGQQGVFVRTTTDEARNDVNDFQACPQTIISLELCLCGI